MFEYECEVFYEDTDMGGRVYHANYLKYIERARSKFIETLNVDQRALLLEGQKFFVVKNIVADYLSPAFFGDKLLIYTTLLDIKKASMVLKQEIFQQKDINKIFTSSVRLALLNSTGKPEKFPTDLVFNIENYFKFIQK